MRPACAMPAWGMSNDQVPMTNQCPMPNAQGRGEALLHWSLVLGHSLVIGTWSLERRVVIRAVVGAVAVEDLASRIGVVEVVVAGFTKDAVGAAVALDVVVAV